MRASLIRFSSRSFATSCCSRSFFAFKQTRSFMLSTAQLRLSIVAYGASELTCNMAERMRVGQPLGSGI